MQCEIQTSDLNYGCAEFWKTSAMFTVWAERSPLPTQKPKQDRSII